MKSKEVELFIAQTISANSQSVLGNNSFRLEVKIIVETLVKFRSKPGKARLENPDNYRFITASCYYLNLLPKKMAFINRSGDLYKLLRSRIILFSSSLLCYNISVVKRSRQPK